MEVKYTAEQQGSVLLVSLVLLLILTLAGITSIQLTSLEEKMTGNYRDEQLAFHAAEIAIQEAETYVTQTSLLPEQFTPSCTNGLCFNGFNSQEPGTCEVNPAFPWEQESNWSSTGHHRSVQVNLEGISVPALYLIEFRCYVSKEIDGPDPDPSDPSDWAHYYRITVLAHGGSTQSRAMLQTTFIKSD